MREELISQLENYKPCNEQELRELALSVNPVRLKNHPIELTREDFLGLYRQILQRGKKHEG